MEIFTKYNNTNNSDLLIKESNGLKILEEVLKDNEYLNIPKVISADENRLQIQKIYSRLSMLGSRRPVERKCFV